MREKDIHELIERQDPEAKQRIWEKVCAQVDVTTQATQATAAKRVNKRKLLTWLTATVAAVIVVALSITLPLVLKDDGMRYCDSGQYTTAELGQTLSEYFTEHNKNLLYVDWYDVSEETITEYGYSKKDQSDIIYFSEVIHNVETGEIVTLSITGNKTHVDIFAEYYNANIVSTIEVKNVHIQLQLLQDRTLAVFEYQGHTYYLELIGGDQARLTTIIENMLK